MDDIRKLAERIVDAVHNELSFNESPEAEADRDSIGDRYRELKRKQSFTESACQARVEFAERVIREAIESKP